MSNDSFIQLPSEQVESLCEKTIRIITKVRFEEEKSFILKRQEKINNGFFRRKFLKPLSYDDVLRKIKSGDAWSDTYWYLCSIRSRGRRHYFTARRLLKSSKATPGMMTISCSDYNDISRWDDE